MIAAVIGEELGLIGILATALAFAAFAVLGFRIAMRCREPFGKYLATGITCLVAGQAVVNLGAVLGFLPLTGVPLPLISSGGSSLVVFMTMAGILLNIAAVRHAAPAPGGAPGPKLPDDDAPKPKPAQAKQAPPSDALRVLIAAGGTAGHVVPALAVAAELADSGAEVVFAGTPDRIESQLVPAAGYPFHTFRRQGFRAPAVAGLLKAVGLAAVAPARLPAHAPPSCARRSCSAAGYVAGPMFAAAAPRGSRRRCWRSTRTWACRPAGARRSCGGCSCPFRSTGCTRRTTSSPAGRCRATC